MSYSDTSRDALFDRVKPRKDRTYKKKAVKPYVKRTKPYVKPAEFSKKKKPLTKKKSCSCHQ